MSRRSAFTLIEMLLVVAIIALLIAILLPSLDFSKEIARRTRCSAQLHGQGIGCFSYATDNIRHLPPGKRDNGDEHCIWVATPTHDALAGRPISQPASHVLWEEPAESVVCPGIPREFGYFRPGLGWVIGYNYLGRHPVDSAAGTWISPDRGNDDPTLYLVVDLNNWSPADNWAFVGHTRRGGLVIGSSQTPQALRSEGGNILNLGGSVFWQPIELMTYRRSGWGDAYPCYW